MLDRERSIEVLERVLEAAGPVEADAFLLASDNAISRFAGSSLEQNIAERSASLSLRIVIEGRMGVATTTRFDDDELRRIAAAARDAAMRSEPDPRFSSLCRDLSPSPEVDSFDPATAALSPEQKALRLRELFGLGQANGVRFAGFFSNTAASAAAANTHGVRRWAPFTRAESLLVAIAPGGSGFATRIGKSADSIDLTALGRQAINRALLATDSIETFEPGPWDVILEPPATAEILDWMNLITFSGQAWDDESSFFRGNLGTRVLGNNFTLIDDPLDPSFLPFPFDAEGTPRRRTPLVKAGCPVTPAVDLLMAQRHALAAHGHATGLGSEEHGAALHLQLTPGARSRDEIVSSTKRGIWITRFHYVNGLIEPKGALMTGMTRDGTFRIEDGRVVARLPNLRWTQSMVRAFSQIEEIASIPEPVGTWWNPFGGTLCPAIKVSNWTFTGVQG